MGLVLFGCSASAPAATPTGDRAEIFMPPATPAPSAFGAPAQPSPSPVVTRAATAVPGTSPVVGASPRAPGSPGTFASPAPIGRPSAAVSPSPVALTPPGPLAGTLVYARDGRIVAQGAAGGDPSMLVAGSDLSAPRLSPDGRMVLYVGGVGQAAELYVVPVAGGASRRLTSNARPERGASWSPWGTGIAYTLPRAVAPSGEPIRTEPDEIWIHDVATGASHKLADGFDPAWSPDGTRLAYATNGRRTDQGATENAIAVIGVDGQAGRAVLEVSALQRDLQPILNIPFRPDTVRLRAPAWAPDGRRLVASADGHTSMAATFDDQGQDIRLWALAYEGSVGVAHWAPRGERLAVESRPATGVGAVVLIDITSGLERRVGGMQAGFSARAPAWSPDGSRLALLTGAPIDEASPGAVQSELSLIEPDGALVREVARGSIRDPHWGTGSP